MLYRASFTEMRAEFSILINNFHICNADLELSKPNIICTETVLNDANSPH